MNPEISSRQTIYDKIESIEESARRRALKFLPIYLPLSLLGNDVAAKFLGNRLASIRHEFNQANDKLRVLEMAEGFPTVKQYIEAIKQLTSYIPNELQRSAYYPFAGFDIFWGSAFKNVALEDRNYNVGEDKHDLWWSPEDYDTEKLSDFVDQIKEKGLIPTEHQVNFITGDSESGENFARYNKAENTLIYKGGHTFLTYASAMTKRESFTFGAIVLSGDNPKTPVAKVDGFLKEQGYQLTYSAWGRQPEIGFPWAIEIINPRVYVRNLTYSNVRGLIVSDPAI